MQAVIGCLVVVCVCGGRALSGCHTTDAIVGKVTGCRQDSWLAGRVEQVFDLKKRPAETNTDR